MHSASQIPAIRDEVSLLAGGQCAHVAQAGGAKTAMTKEQSRNAAYIRDAFSATLRATIPVATGRHSSSADIEDFLYHVYKGSESLADGRLDVARASLETALRMQPQDPSAQDLLGKLYFKLGVYPRAIELYQEIVRQFPDSLPPRINLALAFLKTAQLREAIAHLLPVIERDPTHTRAWGYLGLCWSRLSEYAKAREAFLRAGHHAMALRMEQALEAQYGAGASPFLTPSAAGMDAPKLVDSEEIDTSALDPGVVRVASDTLASPGRWTMREPGEPLTHEAEAPSTLSSWASQLSFAPVGRTIEELQGMIIAHEGCAIRATKEAFGAGWSRGPAVRRKNGDAIEGDSPLLWVAAGWCAVAQRENSWRYTLSLRDEGLIVLERHVLAFDGALHLEALLSRDGALPALSFVGRGVIAIEGEGTLATLRCTADHPVVCALSQLVAYSPGIAHSLDGERVSLNGEGIVAVQQSNAGHLVQRQIPVKERQF